MPLRVKLLVMLVLILAFGLFFFSRPAGKSSGKVGTMPQNNPVVVDLAVSGTGG